MKNILYTILMVVFILLPVYAQETSEKQKVQDTFEELESGKLTLRFVDAIKGTMVEGASVSIEGLGDFTSDYEGAVKFDPPSEDKTIIVKFTHPQYISATFGVEVMAGTLFFNRFSVSPRMPIGNLRVVLDWGKKPNDLDAHFVKSGLYHVSFRNMRVSQDNSAQLDRDAQQGFGPETITSNNVDESASYVYFVHDFTNQSASGSEALSNSRGSVKVYGGNNQLLSIFQVPQSAVGTFWEVFRIVNGNIEPVNRVLNSAPQY